MVQTRREPEPGVEELFEIITACVPQAESFQGTVIRSASLRHASVQQLFSGVGAADVGGRWNPRGLRAAYASLSVITAVREAYQNLLDYGFSSPVMRPRVICGAEVSLQAVFNLTNQRIRRRLGFSLSDLLEEDWHALQVQGKESWTQAIGRGAALAGFEGLLVPSARDRPEGVNLVLFPESLRSGSTVEILGAKDLPSHPPNP